VQSTPTNIATDEKRSSHVDDMDGRRPDLASRADVEALLRRFYYQVFDDDLLAEPFADLAASGFESHVPVMCDFWETVLFRAGLYRGSALAVHREVQHRTPLAAVHFVRWLALWKSTVDRMYSGPVAEQAKTQATRIAWSMCQRLTGQRAAELDAALDATATVAVTAPTFASAGWPA
jgi:hemoglobin